MEDARRGVHARARGGFGRELPFGGLRQRAFDLVGSRRERRSRFGHLRRDSGETPGGNCTRAKRLVQPATATRRRRSPFVARLEPGRVRRRLHAVREHADRAPRRRGRGRRADVRGGERREGNLAGRRDALPDGGGGGGGGDWKKRQPGEAVPGAAHVPAHRGLQRGRLRARVVGRHADYEKQSVVWRRERRDGRRRVSPTYRQPRKTKEEGLPVSFGAPRRDGVVPRRGVRRERGDERPGGDAGHRQDVRGRDSRRARESRES